VIRRLRILNYLYAILIVVLFYSNSYPYETCKTSGGTDIKWRNASATYYINTSGGPSESLSAIIAGMQTWTDVSTSVFTFVYGGTTSSTAYGVLDRTNIVTFGLLGSGILAQNSYWYYPSSGEIVDSDIQFNAAYTWDTSGSPGSYDVQNIGTHESGHSLCLSDLYNSSDSEKTMYGYGSPEETKKRTLDQDDIDGITYLYPCPDIDGDGYTTCQNDCNDNDPKEHPNQTWYKDADGDGYSTGDITIQCSRPAGYKIASELTAASVDCNDNNPAIHPGAADTTCNGVDENCSGAADEGYVPTPATCGVGECTRTGQLICQNGSTVNTCSPGIPQTEGPYGNPTCSDGKDNDCDAKTDVSDPDCTLVDPPDLIIYSMTAAPSTSAAGLTISITDTTKNQGTGSAGASTTKLYWSANSIYDAGDTLMGSRTVPALAAGTKNSGSTSVTVPSGTCSGTYYIIARADADNVVPESNESNNTKSTSVKIGIDLTVSALTAPSTSGAGLTITVTDTTKNSGCPAAASTTNIYLSTNSTYDAGDTYLVSRLVPALATNAADTGSTSITIPSGITAGTYYIIARADADNTNPNETSETNNNRSISIKIGPDLTVSALTAPSTSGAGLTITVTDTTKDSVSPAAASTTKIYLSTNSTYDSGDTYLGSRPVPALATNAADTASTSVAIPSGTASGKYYIIARADADNTNPNETSETNNNRSKSIIIGPDLTVYALSAPTSAGRGATITVIDTIKNIGGGSADATTTRLYLSTDTIYDAGDIELGSRAVLSIAAGTSNAGNTSVTIPSGIATGAYYIIAKSDADGVVGETNETNNNRYRAITINP
jgi:subtilase family serine protease